MYGLVQQADRHEPRSSRIAARPCRTAGSGRFLHAAHPLACARCRALPSSDRLHTVEVSRSSSPMPATPVCSGRRPSVRWVGASCCCNRFAHFKNRRFRASDLSLQVGTEPIYPGIPGWAPQIRWKSCGRPRLALRALRALTISVEFWRSAWPRQQLASPILDAIG